MNRQAGEDDASASARPEAAGLPIDIWIERAAVGRSAWALILVCSLIALADGLDMQLLSYTAAFISEDLSISRATLGTIFAAGAFGTMLGPCSLASLATVSDGAGQSFTP